MQHIQPLEDLSNPDKIGNKARNLRFLRDKGFNIPSTLICPRETYEQRDRDSTLQQLKKELLSLTKPGQAYAVRSSANLEDGEDHSFAGQFESRLDINGVDEMMAAIQNVWNSAHSDRVQAYFKQHNLSPGKLAMGVIIQEMVSPQISGVSFSKNPLTGLDETVVEAVKGSSEAFLQHGITPDRWVHKWGDWIESPSKSEIPLSLIQEIVNQTKKISQVFGKPADLEWVFDGEKLFWVQMRELTSIKELRIYSNRISKEVLPGIIKPLVWSINTPMVNGAWVDLFTELIGDNDIQPGELAQQFYGRAYFNMTTIGRIFTSLGMPAETLEILMGIEDGGEDRPTLRPGIKSLVHIPRMLQFAWEKINFQHKLARLIPELENKYHQIASQANHRSQMDEGALLQKIETLYGLTQQMAYLNIVTPLLMHFYNRLLRSRLEKAGIDFENYDITGGSEKLKEFDPNPSLVTLNQAFMDLEEEQKAVIREGGYQAFKKMQGIEELQKLAEDFISRFGHLSDSGNDFSSVPWQEDPDLVIKMMTEFHPSQNGKQIIHFEDLKLPAIQKMWLRRANENARRYRIYREHVSFTYTYGYGLFRQFVLPLGELFLKKGILADRDDIFYLSLDEIRGEVFGETAGNLAQLVEERKAKWNSYTNLSLPEIIYGDEEPPVISDFTLSQTLKGTPTSRGYYSGPVQVVRGIHDFSKLQEGDVLVIPFSDVGWTPLFSKAGAIIAESGGMLSHSSIIAREYGIPAVVSVAGAIQIPDQTVVSVDGYLGVIHILEEEKK